MHAFHLIKNGDAASAFEQRPINLPEPAAHQVQIHVESFGLNFADVMARLGYYKACPPLPTVIGYDVVGRITKLGSDVRHLSLGNRVAALTRFGGYATDVITDVHGVVSIPENVPAGECLALATQYATAYYAAEFSMTLSPGERVLIQAAAGGVGTALVQLAKRRGCYVIGTAGSRDKMEYLKNIGADECINYRDTDFYDYILSKYGEKSLDAVFDSIGGASVKKAMKLLAQGGRMAIYGAAQIAGKDSKKNMLRALRTLIGFGKYKATDFFGKSQTMIGVNMLQLGDYKPYIIQNCMTSVRDLYIAGEIKPTVGKIFKSDQLAEAHNYLQTRQSIGKIAIDL